MIICVRGVFVCARVCACLLEPCWVRFFFVVCVCVCVCVSVYVYVLWGGVSFCLCCVWATQEILFKSSDLVHGGVRRSTKASLRFIAYSRRVDGRTYVVHARTLGEKLIPASSLNLGLGPRLFFVGVSTFLCSVGVSTCALCTVEAYLCGRWSRQRFI